MRPNPQFPADLFTFNEWLIIHRSYIENKNKKTGSKL